MHLQTANDLLLCIEELDLKALLSLKEYYGGSNQVNSARYGTRGVDFSAGMRVYDTNPLKGGPMMNGSARLGIGLFLARRRPPTRRAIPTGGKDGKVILSAGWYDIADPANPRAIGFMDVQGLGLHRIWWTGGRYAYASALLDGFLDHIFICIDMADPTKPRQVGRWWIPGMNAAAGETPHWKGR